MLSLLKPPEIFGGKMLPPNLQICLQKRTDFFSDCASKGPKNAPLSQPVGKNPKILTYYLSSAMGLGDPEVKLHLLPKTAMSRHRDSKIIPSWAKTAFFCFLNRAPRVLGGDAVSPCRIIFSLQNYNSTWGFLKISPMGRVLWPSS